MTQSFYEIGKEKSKIDVKISYRIIELFSEGLYSSPNKAVEELVSNAFDAGATNVHVILSQDLAAHDASIAVIDNGVGMDEGELKLHWLIGVSNKRKSGARWPRNRKQIGKFGIGKLATFVLANRLTHISKVSTKYYSSSMDFTRIPGTADSGIQTNEKVEIPLLELLEADAKTAVSSWTDGAKPGYKAIKLFGSRASDSWTVAVMSDLKDMACEIQLGRLRWILHTAMPLRDDFKLFLNGEPIEPSKISGKKVKKWILGKDLTDLPQPAPRKDISVNEDTSVDKRAPERYGLYHPQLGRITGYAELYEDLLTTGKSADIERSHGFFVYVRGRLINTHDEYFGIDSNLLRHGTFSRFRMVVNMDKLDDELRSSRETVRRSGLFNVARNMLHGVFNVARTALQTHERLTTPGAQVAARVSATPPSLTRGPLLALLEEALDGKISPKYTRVPQDLSTSEKRIFLEDFKRRFDTSQGFVDTVLAYLSHEDGLAVYDAAKGILEINTRHPFVAYFLDDYENRKRNLSLELYALSEVLTEAYLYQHRLSEANVRDIITERDELLRYLAHSTGKRNANMIANDLIDATSDKDALEKELVAAFDSMGFDAIPLGGPRKPDGIATAHLGASEGRVSQRYQVSLEAKSKEKPEKKVAAKEVNVSAIARQRDDYKCEHAVVVGPDFPTTRGESSALVEEIKADKENTVRTITLVRVLDLARLVRLVPLKRVNLERLRGLFNDCISPEDSKSWIDKLVEEEPEDQHYREILETIWQEQREEQNQPVKYPGLLVALRKEKKLRFEEGDLIDRCKALYRMVPRFVIAREAVVELTQRPDKIMEAIKVAIKEYPEEEQKLTIL